MATDGGLSRLRAGRFVGAPSLERLRGQKVWSLREDAEGKLWIGTHGAGLFMLKDGALTQFTTRDGLPSNKIHFIVEDAQGSLWMSGPSGVAAVSRRELESLSGRGAGQLAVRVYSTAEGLSTNQMNGGVQPAGAMLASGEMWFPSAKGAVRIEHGAPDRRSAPPVLIEQVLADDRAAPFSKSLVLTPGRGKLEIHYTAIRLRSPDRIRFKFRMESFDQDWTDAGQRRVAYYTNLPAGNYRFRVVAYEMDDPRSAVDEARLAVWNLRRNTSALYWGLAPAISQLARRLSLETAIPIRFESSGAPLDLGAEAERSLLMIVREALQNALRHAAPKHVSVALRSDRHGLQVEIEDDGRGFDLSIINSSDGRHYGLIGMRERAEKLGGRLSLTSSPGKGTQVRLSVPKTEHDFSHE